MLHPTPRRLVLPILAAALCALLTPLAHADSRARFDATASAFHRSKVQIPVANLTPPPGAQVLNYKFGPMKIQPGQNIIGIDLEKDRPAVDGWIVGFKPGLVYASNGKSPSVKIVHLHHAVWLVGDSLDQLRPRYAAGEEKTYFMAPPGFGFRYTTKQYWLLNHMIHDLTSQPQDVYLTYTLWFIPDTAPEAASITDVDLQWLDVEGGKPYPVFNALKGAGSHGRMTFPTATSYRDGIIRNRWVADHDGTMVGTAGHLHPGGLWTDLMITRDGVTKRVFRSRANYFEPAGPVSWDVAMSASSDNWKVNFKKGDILSVRATYDTSRASWYEVMGIMPTMITDHQVAGGVDPFDPNAKIDQTDYLTHARLPENIDTDVRQPAGLNNPLRQRSGPFRDKITIKNFVYSQGDLTSQGKAGLVPRVRQGHSLEFVNQDNPLTIRFHTITACKAPCNLTGGIGYPLANGPTDFDSGELGYGPAVGAGSYDSGYADTGQVPITAVNNVPTDKSNCAGVPGIVGVIATGCVGNVVYQTPSNLTPGTYTYFCRIHPFMRGAFRVVPARKH
jgi:hypothetical protein